MMLDMTDDYQLILSFLQAMNMQELAMDFGVSERTLYNRFSKLQGVDRAFQGLKKNERSLIYDLMTGETSARAICRKHGIRTDHFTSVCKNLVPGAFEHITIDWRTPGAPIAFKFSRVVEELVSKITSSHQPSSEEITFVLHYLGS